MRRSSDQDRAYAFQFAHQLGRSVLLRRVADMIRYGFVSAEKTRDGFLVNKVDSATQDQFADLLEPKRWEELWRAVDEGKRDAGLWTKVEIEKGLPRSIGSYFGIKKAPPFEKWARKDIDSLMVPLIKPFETKYGTFIGYDSSLEIENHFLAIVAQRARAWQIEAGIHPALEIANTTGADIMSVGVLLSSMHLKHIHFVLLAAKHCPAISIPDSFMNWAEQAKLKRGIQEFTGMSEKRVRAAIHAIALDPADAPKLSSQTRPFIPLLISLGNGLLYYPASSAFWNPFIAIGKLAEWRDPKARDTIAAPREAWLREEIYAGFQGTRYVCIKGATVLRAEGRIFTDVDAAVLDRTSGELGIFQIKWQDYFTNDVRELRSRSSNQARELDQWAERISAWIQRASILDVSRTFRINVGEHGPVTKILLFGISRGFIRTHGYGFFVKHPMLSVGTFAQFARIRMEVGPVGNALDKIHQTLRAEEDRRTKCRPIPTAIHANGIKIEFADLWHFTELD